MAITNRERVGKGLDLLMEGLQRYVEIEMRRAFAGRWLDEAQAAGRRTLQASDDNKRATGWDTKSLLDCIWSRWNEVFGQKLSQSERSITGELRETRNRWAHNEPFSSDDALRALDSIQRLLTAVSAPQAQDVGKMRSELMRTIYDEQARNVTRRLEVAPTQGQPTSGLLPWREIVAPHPDVASGRYQQAEFAADIGQVQRGEASAEYQQPRDFFRRTFLTEGLRQLLLDALRQLGGEGSNPVVKLQTNFGGGKTHAMLALYHLVSGASIDDLPGVEPLLQEAGLSQPPEAQRVVLVGTALSPGQPHRKPDGTIVHTMWGELAWQLLGADGYAQVAEADRNGVSPGSDALRDLFSAAAPCLILIDEWVAYLRQLVGVPDLPAGSFDANYSFAQSLTEAVKAVPHTLLVATLPESDIEIGGEAGRQALSRLANVFSRVEAVWRPASAEESFEIVRRRLFEPIVDSSLFAQRDAVVQKFAALYQSQPQSFPAGCKESSYQKRMRYAYPIHPELFDRLYEGWSSLERFQRTRGVLRLMAKVIHDLWAENDRSLMITPGFVPIGEATVREELTRYLEDNWVPVIERDVDGTNALPLQLDQANQNLGRYSACRRVARTLYLGSAPTAEAANRGLDEQHLSLGCVQPGESPATFGDALRRLTDQATFLYADGGRYWYSTQPSVTRLAQDRAAQQSVDDVNQEIVKQLRAKLSKSNEFGDFSRVHVAPEGPADVADDRDARLVVLGPDDAHVNHDDTSPARLAARRILDSRGAGPRSYRNSIVFLAPDQGKLNDLKEAVRSYLAWNSIHREQETLNLNAYQRHQAQDRVMNAEQVMRNRIPETYIWLISPDQPVPAGPVEWQASRLPADTSVSLAQRASRKLRNDGRLTSEFGAVLLRKDLDGIPLWREEGERVSVKQLCEDYAKYPYLQRLTDSNVLINGIQSGLALTTWTTDSFAYAQRWDPGTGRYEGLVAGENTSVHADGSSVLVRPEAAIRQMDAEAEARRALAATSESSNNDNNYPSTDNGSTSARTGPSDGTGAYRTNSSGGTTVTPARPRRFHGTVELSDQRLGRDASKIAEEVVQHLLIQTHGKVRVTLEIEADIPDGASDELIRTVSENARTLKFSNYAFEEE